MPRTITSPSPKQALLNWAKRNNITPPDLARATGYSYMHAWQLLRGNADVTTETIGRLVIAYGPESVKDIAAVMQATGATSGGR